MKMATKTYEVYELHFVWYVDIYCPENAFLAGFSPEKIHTGQPGVVVRDVYQGQVI